MQEEKSDRELLGQMTVAVLQWYAENARVLPWRTDITPYRVWVSEIMLQQTRVGAVIGYFQKFMARYPTIRDLAASSEDELLKYWQGLGYYSRARNLHRAAQEIVSRYGGVFPSDYQEIRALPGIGDYTAAAISSIAFGEPRPAVDGNHLRVTARLLRYGKDIRSPEAKREITALLADVIPARMPGTFNQALMDLGSLVCLPNGAPLCGSCPAQAFCRAHAAGQETVFPVRSAKPARRVEERCVFLLFRDGSVALRKRGRGLLAGLWEYPSTPESERQASLRDWGLDGENWSFCGTGRHVFTHVEWHMRAYRAETGRTRLPEGWVWADAEEIRSRYAIPSAFTPFDDCVREGLR